MSQRHEPPGLIKMMIKLNQTIIVTQSQFGKHKKSGSFQRAFVDCIVLMADSQRIIGEMVNHGFICVDNESVRSPPDCDILNNSEIRLTVKNNTQYASLYFNINQRITPFERLGEDQNWFRENAKYLIFVDPTFGRKDALHRTLLNTI